MSEHRSCWKGTNAHVSNPHKCHKLATKADLIALFVGMVNDCKADNGEVWSGKLDDLGPDDTYRREGQDATDGNL